jgi:type I restriction enzyme M protein
MNNGDTGWITGFIWGIANDVLRDLYGRGKYRDVILLMTVLRRLDSVLEDTKHIVLERKRELDEQRVVNQEMALRAAAGQAFYNTSKFTLKDLRNRTNQAQLKADFEAYLDGFSNNVQDILDNFEFRNLIPRLFRADAFGTLVEKFTHPDLNLSPKPARNSKGAVLPGLDNHGMGSVFEALVRKFNEANNEEAGEHWTPRDAIALMANLIFRPIADEIHDGTYLLYDPAIGTGGMLTVGEETLAQLAEGHDRSVSTHLFGQEINAETYAICKADLLLKGEGDSADNIIGGPEHSTISNDAFPSTTFDFMMSNPPYGKSWKTDLERLGGKSDLVDPRFIIHHDGDPEFSLVPRSSDGQLLFLVTMLSKMKDTPLGSRVAVVHNGSALFTGDAGQGESNVRRWVIENDWLEGIIQLPNNMFYNTGITTYIWVLTNRKPEHRKGMIQLIDASEWFTSLPRNLGQKNCELSQDNIKRITNVFLEMAKEEKSKVFPNEHFGYRKVTIDRPLRLHSQLSDARIEAIRLGPSDNDLRSEIYDRFGEAVFDDFASVKSGIEALFEASDDDEEESLETGLKVSTAQRKRLLNEKTWSGAAKVAEVAKQLQEKLGDAVFEDHNLFRTQVVATLKEVGIKLNASELKQLYGAVSWVEESAPPVIKRVHKEGTPADRLMGLIELELDGEVKVGEYEADPSLRDTEQVPLLEKGGVAAFVEREVWPYVTDAWVVTGSEKIGYEISFTREFYKPATLRSREEIRSDVLALETEFEGLIQTVDEEAKPHVS